ncbi:MAG: ATP-binding protein [Bdellovibrionales bacterium]|jgi:two-component system osmolarity sensor histidine kinase EnvZ|nr:ATP-binding protein [Bdellovibrionales bacterium]
MGSRILTTLKQKLLPSTLFGRSLMIIATPILLLQLIVSFVFFDRHWDSMSSRLVYAIAGEVSMLTTQIREADGDAAREAIIADAAKSLELQIHIEDLDPKALQESASPFEKFYWFSIGGKLDAALDRRLTQAFQVHDYADDSRRFQIVVQLDDKRMAVFLCPERRLNSSTTYIFILWLIGSAIVLFGIAIIFMRNQIRPIRRLAIAAEKFGKGQDVPDFKPVGAREVRQASRAFLDMRDRLKRQIEQRTAMLAGVSHDLRTPLTRMKLQLAMAGDDEMAAHLRQDIDEMEKMLEAYLDFAKGESSEAPEMTDLGSILDRIIGRAQRHGDAVQAQVADKLMIRLRPVATERALANIVGNACKYGTNVWVNAYEQSNAIEIVIDDDGPGIPENLREDVFRPFFRIEKSRNKKTGGIGLGLSIARDIIHAHGGEIFLENSNRGGLRVVVRLPL